MRSKKTEKKTSNKKAMATSGRSVIGVDISPSHIRMVQLSGRQLSQVQLEKYAITTLPANVVSGGEVVDFDQLVSHLQQCYSKMKTNCKQANIALPASAVTIEENLRFVPEGSNMTLQEFVELEVSNIGSLDEMNYDWQVLSGNPGSEQTVLMVAAKKEAVERATDLLDEVGINASNVDVDIFAVANAFAYADMQNGDSFGRQRIALFDIGDTVLKALIVENGQILYKQESNFGLEQLVQSVQRAYQATDGEALAMITGEMKRPDDYKAMVVDGFNAQIAQEVQRVMQFFYATQNMDSMSNVKHIYISGSGCAAPGISEVVYAQTNIATEQLNPASFAINKLKGDGTRFDKDAASLTTAFGLALRGLV